MKKYASTNNIKPKEIELKSEDEIKLDYDRSIIVSTPEGKSLEITLNRFGRLDIKSISFKDVSLNSVGNIKEIELL